MARFLATAILLWVGVIGKDVLAQTTNEPSPVPPECGASNPNGNFIDQSEPEKPGPFHDLTSAELRKLREFLEKDPKIRAVKSSNASIDSSYIFSAELLLNKKQEILNFLDRGGPQPIRQAHVIMFRGDLQPPVVEEYVCGPLPDVAQCGLLNRTNSRNPIEFSLRPVHFLERKTFFKVMPKKIDDKVGRLLTESYGHKFTGCTREGDCLVAYPSGVTSAITGDISKRLLWINAIYNLPSQFLHVLDFSFLLNLNETDPEKWSVEKVWYSGQLFDSLEELRDQYDSNNITKTRVQKPILDDNLFSNLRRRGEPVPLKPQRPPQLVEPDGKRYSVKEHQVKYLDWTFHYRLSPLAGPVLYDIRFKGERIIYELALSQVAVLSSGFAPTAQSFNIPVLGMKSKALVPGADCPVTATLLRSTFMSQQDEEPADFEASMCLFENHDGHPLRQHLSYTAREGGFYGGMMDTMLILRSSLSVMGKDLIVDFWFHQHGVVHAKLFSTGYQKVTFVTDAEQAYGHRIQDNLVGNLEQLLVSWKVDLDIGGTSNRYETLDINRENLSLTAFPDRPYSQSRISQTLKTTEKESILNLQYPTPKYHIVHNKDMKNKYNVSRAYRIEIRGAVKNRLEPGLGADVSQGWTGQQMVVTRHKDEELRSGSIYGLLDSARPVVNFSSFYQDDEDIVDEDLVFWITGSAYHLPRSEDLPNTPGLYDNHLNVFLMPHNYFPECPTLSSRDSIYVEYRDPSDPSKGVKVDRNGNSRDACVVPKSSLEEDLEQNPDRVLQSRKPSRVDCFFD